jgi:hypothetical protein
VTEFLTTFDGSFAKHHHRWYRGMGARVRYSWPKVAPLESRNQAALTRTSVVWNGRQGNPGLTLGWRAR